MKNHPDIKSWIQARNECPEELIHRVEAQHAAAAGLPTLSAIFLALDRVQNAGNIVSRHEVEALLTDLAHVARGEAQARLRLAWEDEHIELPGVCTIPHDLLEHEALRERTAPKTNPARELAIFLGVEIPADLPDGEYTPPTYVTPAYHPGSDPEDAERRADKTNALIHRHSLGGMVARCTPNSAVAAIADQLLPLYTAPGEREPDGRQGVQRVLEMLVENWPELPHKESADICLANQWNYAAHGISQALGERIWLHQGSADWEYVDLDPEKVYAAFVAGKTASEVKASIQKAEATYVADHRSARNGDKVRRSV